MVGMKNTGTKRFQYDHAKTVGTLRRSPKGHIQQVFRLSREMYERNREIPTNVSKWSLRDAEYFGILYEDKAVKSPIEILEIVNLKTGSRTRTRKISPPAELPENLTFIREFLIEYINFSIEDCNIDSDWEFLRQSIAQIRECKNDMERVDFNSYLADKDCIQKRMFYDVYSSSLRFLDMVVKYLRILITPNQLSESLYIELFRSFTSTCYLTPMSGDILVRHLMLGKHCVTSIPDIRYCNLDTDLLAFVTAEVRRIESSITTPPKRGRIVVRGPHHVFVDEEHPVNVPMMQENDDQTFLIQSSVDDKVLGQHAGELLLERKYSCFKPCVLGIICLKTEVILTCLDMDISHYEKITESGNVEDERSRIHYSHPYDFLIADERKELLDAMILLALAQR